jgi:hypothetical protein
MQHFPWMWVMFGMFFWLFLIRPGHLRACRTQGSTRETGEPIGRGHRRETGEGLGGALAERDALIANLEERVRVLERIATDDSARLRAEIDSLRDPPARGGAAS